jgi:hypothetical protein
VLSRAGPRAGPGGSLRRISTIVLLSLLLPVAGARAGDPGGFSFDLTPYVWIVSADGTFGVADGTREPPEVSGGGDLFSSASSIEGAFMLKGEARYGDFGLWFDGAWARLGVTASGAGLLYAGADATTDLGFATTALSYRLPIDDPFTVRTFVGARIWYADIDLRIDPGLLAERSSSGHDTWVDPVIGGTARYAITDDFFATLVGDVGGFDVASRLTWQVFGGLGYQIADWFAASLGYRYLTDDYSNDGFVLDIAAQGFLVGLGFRY